VDRARSSSPRRTPARRRCRLHPRAHPLRLRKSAFARFDADGSFAGGGEVLVPDRSAPAITGAERDDFHGLVSGDPRMPATLRMI
jgi:hypothetical protein